MRRLKIGHVTFDMDIGGAEQVIRNLIEGTDRDRFDPSILCLESQLGPIGNKMRENGFLLTTFGRKPGFDTKLVRSMRRFVFEQQIDLLHCHQYTPYVYGLLAASFCEAKIIFTEHGRFHPESFKWKRILVNPFLALATDSITAISRATKDALVKYERMPADKIDVIYNGVFDFSKREFDIHRLRQKWSLGDSGMRIIGTISRLDPIKNQRLMLEAFQRVRQCCDRVKLVIVGDGPMREELKSHARALKIDDDVVFTGFQVEPYEFVKLIDIFLLSSLSEGTSMTLLEAMSFSKPCVVTDVGGNPEIVIDGKTGFVTPSFDAEQFAAGIITLLENDKLRTKFGKAARMKFEACFSIEKMVDAYQDLYKSLCYSS